eukprot:Seg1794.5 transcript_id=Seg1794.5/GoldUCD/mRNA.D3Y31 product="hypothetical protein" protein_id=Seg1794.5/GoldUCD/D3Y31
MEQAWNSGYIDSRDVLKKIKNQHLDKLHDEREEGNVLDEMLTNSDYPDDSQKPSAAESLPGDDTVSDFSELALHLRMTSDQDLGNSQDPESNKGVLMKHHIKM